MRFLGFAPGVDDDPPMVVFWVDSHRELHALFHDKQLLHELVVVLSENRLLTSGDLHDTFPATRERNAGRLSQAEFYYTEAQSTFLE